MLNPSRVTPALLTRMSTFSKSSRICLLTALMPAGSLTSAVYALAASLPTVALISSAVRRALDSVRLTTATRAPAPARRWAMACPMPRPAPVTTATWLARGEGFGIMGPALIERPSAPRNPQLSTSTAYFSGVCWVAISIPTATSAP